MAAFNTAVGDCKCGVPPLDDCEDECTVMDNTLDVEIEISGIGNDSCTPGPCSDLNNTWIFTAPLQTGLDECVLSEGSINEGYSGVDCGGFTTYEAQVFVGKSGNPPARPYFPTSDWLIMAVIRDVVSGHYVVFGVTGSTAAQSLANVCDGGEVALPLITEQAAFKCDASGASAIFRVIP